MTTETAALPPHLYRSEAFVEDVLDLLPQPLPLSAAEAAANRRAGWLLALPGTVAAVAAALLFGAPA